MKQSTSNINTSEVIIVVINSILGAGILTLPRTISKAVGTPDVWISVILSGLIVTTISILLVTLCRRFPGKTVFEFIPEITGQWIAYLLGLLIIVYFVVLCSFEVRVMAEITSMYILERTPTWVTIMVSLWIGIYMLTGGLKVIIRVFSIVLPVTLVLLALVFLLSSKMFEINNLRPLLGDGFMPVLKGLKPSCLSYSGYEVLLIITAYMVDVKASNKAAIYSILSCTIIYLVTIVTVVGNLSLPGIQTRMWPTFDMVRSFEIEGFLFERYESLFIVFWLMQIFATYAFKHYFAAIGIRDLFRLKNITSIQFAMLPVLYVIAYLPKNLEETLALGDFLGNMSIFLFGLLPLLLLIISFVRKKGGKQASSEALKAS
ncbi:GerAB/ArcD/ProY family transporter [Paenibacillus xylanexedens]|uniref:GerAB/ArcD/ProY family transporter n=1 Tax=Paenibacillus TaxID=44249 RepID=UPI0003E1EA88|nr:MULTISPECIES: GerAB/ArcD/ProY family transporter [unclassified Paenibacillus]ETT43871.1 spore germination protein [Paenibacillus sp. FSL H7-689]KLU54686.1 spore gernimation protein [Paenibacillus sp. VT-400]